MGYQPGRQAFLMMKESGLMHRGCRLAAHQRVLNWFEELRQRVPVK